MPESEGSVHTNGVERNGAPVQDPFPLEEIVRLREEVENLLKAIETRDVIGQAKGVLMERHKLSAEEAFRWLREASQHSNVKVAELARLLAETGEWPPAFARGA